MDFTYKTLEGKRIMVIVFFALISVAWLYFYCQHLNSSQALDFIKTGGLFLAFWIALFVYLNLAPIVVPRISTSWVDKKRGVLLVKLEVENISKVIVFKKDKGIRFQMLKQKIGKEINEWVAFEKEYETRMIPQPLYDGDWPSDREVNSSTPHLYPGESVRTELIFIQELQADEILHLALQFKSAKSLFNYLHPEQWTVTTFVMPPTSA